MAHDRAMSVSVLLRLVPDALAEGRLAGQAEIVETGESVLFHDADEIASFVRERLGAGGE